ncbi:MAG TPA: hypothetical protein VN031_04335 [Candidatus Microsaccharimonas sp.]|nr:hypothetical protein [Candidatus Microsaccharimonas sp.]
MVTSLTALPTFADNEVIWEQADYANSTTDSFVRLAVSSLDPNVVHTPLHELLNMTDEALHVFARRCGAFVLPHAWGFVTAPEGQEWRLGDELGASTQHPDVPHGMLLAAQVERIVRPRQLRRHERRAIDTITTDYYHAMRQTTDTPYLTDMRPCQFTLGILASRSHTRLRILHDIEPRIAINA